MFFQENNTKCHLCHRTFTENEKSSKSLIFDKALLSHIREEIESSFNMICSYLLLQNLSWNAGILSEFAVLKYKDIPKLISSLQL